MSPRPKTGAALAGHIANSAKSRYTKKKVRPRRKGEQEVDDQFIENKAKVAKREGDKRRFADIERRVQERAEGRIE